MFFDDLKLTARKRAILKVPSAIPETGWRPPSYLPDLSNADVISFDVETKENDFSHGPGWARGQSHIVGFSLAAIQRGERGKWYFPIRHEVQSDWNLNPDGCLSYLKRTLETPRIPKVGANLMYDVGSLTSENIYVEGQLIDCQFAEALIDEQGDTNLDWLAQKYLGESKETSLLYDWIDTQYRPKKSERRGEIWRSPPQLVGPYGEADADLPLRVFEQQWPILQAEGTTELFHMECRLIRLLVKMRLRGVTVDMAYAERLYVELGEDIRELYAKLRHVSGINVTGVNSPAEIAPIFDHFGIPYPRTAPSLRHPFGQPSFTKEFLKSVEHPIGELINTIRAYEKIRGTFVKSYLLESSVNSKVHCQFHPLRSDDGGAKTGRFSSSDPNLQNIPIRENSWEKKGQGAGKKVRKAFTKDRGSIRWEKRDYSQIEYRMLAHFAVGPGSDELRQSYIDNPKTDYHDKVYYDVCPLMGWNPEDEEYKSIRRRPIKNTNFGLLYGQGQGKLARTMGMSQADSRKFFESYHAGAPYVKPTMQMCADEAQQYGFVRTVLGRRTRFNLWEPIGNRGEERADALPYAWALQKHGHGIKRAFDYRAVNYKLQGSAADMIKYAMDAADQAGVFDVIGAPLLQVHDELDNDVRDDSPAVREGLRELTHIMETALPIRVPVLVDMKYGPTWGDID